MDHDVNFGIQLSVYISIFCVTVKSIYTSSKHVQSSRKGTLPVIFLHLKAAVWDTATGTQTVNELTEMHLGMKPKKIRKRK